MKIDVIDALPEAGGFKVLVRRDDGLIEKELPYEGSPFFAIREEFYSLVGPAQGFPDEYRLFRLVEVAATEPKVRSCR